MPRANVPFVGGAYQGRSLNQNPQECVNFFLETDQEGGKSPVALYGTPGCKLYYYTTENAPVRGMIVCAGKLYVVIGIKVLQITSSLVETDLGDLVSAPGLTAPVKMAENGLQVMIVDDLTGYIYDIATQTFGSISDSDFPGGVRGLGYQDGYFIVSEKHTGKFFISALYDGLSWAALDFASVEGDPDVVVDVLVDHRELWMFGADSTEVFYNSGNPLFPFERVQGAFLEIGCASHLCAAKLDNSVYWLTNYGTLVRAEGYNPQVVSTRQIEYQWSKYATWSDAMAFTYHWQGHAFYQITFPSEGFTWVYDASNGFWHRRTSYPKNSRHRANCYVFFNGKHLVGDYANGLIYELDTDTYMDNNNTINRWRTTQIVNEKDLNLFCHSLQVDFEAGTGIITGQGSDPQAMLQTSNDGGHTWSNEYWVGTGQIGEYVRRAIWRRLGVSRDGTVKIMFTDPVKWVITGAVAEFTAGTH